MGKPLSDHARTILEFVKAHPGVQAQFIAAELQIGWTVLATEMLLLQENGLVEGRRDPNPDSPLHPLDNPTRFYPKI